MFSKPKDKTKTTDPAAEKEVVASPAPAQTTPDTPVAEDASTPTPPPAAPSTPPPAEAPKVSPEALELAALKDRYTRLLADFDNARKRQVREREEWLKRANEELLGDLLPIVDHLELALKKTPEATSPFTTGIKLVYDQFISLLERYNMTPIEAKGQPFDPSIHEALSQMNSATVPEHVVLDQFRRGWRLAGRLLRPAQVIVSSGAPDQEQAGAEDSNVSD